jgi:formylglycine-generating enzyme required for sulfatase activity
VLTATDSTQYAWEDDHVIGEADKSIFTHYLVEGLQTGAADANTDGWITLDELYDYVHAQVVTRTPKQTPAKWTYKQQDSFVIARNPYPVMKPADLPAELQTAIKSNSVWMREGAVQELDRMLNGTDPELACVAYGTLTTLSGDDSRRVSEAAAKSLETYVEAWHQRTRVASESAHAAPQADLGTVPIEPPTTPTPALQPARKPMPRAALIGIPVIALLLILVVIFAVSRLGQSAAAVQSPGLSAAGAMVKVDAGTYRVGHDSPGGNYAPVQSIDVGQFWIDQYEVTNAQYAAFLAAMGGIPPAGWAEGAAPAGQNDFPVEGVTWDQAAAYCQWASKRLPSEAEWEVAARGSKGSLYPWGDGERAVTLPDGKTYAVGKIPANRSPFGAFDMAGNVWEWVGDTYAPVPDGHKVLRGGSYGFVKDMAYRLHGEPNVRTMFAMAGIRCVADRAPERIGP